MVNRRFHLKFVLLVCYDCLRQLIQRNTTVSSFVNHKQYFPMAHQHFQLCFLSLIHVQILYNQLKTSKKGMKTAKRLSETTNRITIDNTMNKRQRTDLQHTTKKTRVVATRTPLKAQGELRCSEKEGSGCSICGTRRVILLQTR